MSASTAADSMPYVFPTAPTSMRRPAIIAGVVVLAVAAAAIALNHPWFGAFFLLGTAAVFGNAQLVINSVKAVTAEEHPRKKILAVNSAVRLGTITVLALIAAFLVQPDGLGVMFGLAIGQVILVLNTVIPVMKGLRKQP